MSGARLARLIFAIAVCCAPLLAQESSGFDESAPADAPEAVEMPFHVSGRVIDDLTGKPLSGAAVTLAVGGMVIISSCADCDASGGMSPEPEAPREVTTGADGRFAFDNVLPPGGSITASKQGYVPAWQIRSKASDEPGGTVIHKKTDDVVLRLAPTASISGAFRDHRGSPITEGAGITLWTLANWAGWPRLEYGGFADFADDGTYIVRDLLPGRYYLVADPPVRAKEPARDAAGHAVGDVPMRYPASTVRNPNPFFTLREGEHAAIDFRFPQKRLHRVAVTAVANERYSYNILDENGSQAYLFNYLPPWNLSPEMHFEAWLPKGRYRLNGDDNLPFQVADSDLPNLLFSVPDASPERIEVAVIISGSALAAPGCDDAMPVCGFVDVLLVRFVHGPYVEVVSQANLAARFDGKREESQLTKTVSLVPGSYTVAVVPTLNLYAKSIVSGSTDFAAQSLLIRAGDSPEPIRIELAQGAIVDGVVRRGGKPVKAWIYAVADEIQSKSDFREFEPVLSEEDGKFEVQGLAPGSYLFFASDVELTLNVHDPAEIAPWRSRGQVLHVEGGKTSHAILTVAHLPDRSQ
jgi:Carboxypeptidase regulatory-like domain